MSYSLYFSGRAATEKDAGRFLDGIEEAASRLGLGANRTGTTISVTLKSDADDLLIDLDERLVFEGALQPSSDADEDLRTLALLFGPTHQQLDAFSLLDAEAKPLFEHGDVDGLEAQLEESYDEAVKAEKGQPSDGPAGPLDTPWFTNCRMRQTEHGMVLDVLPKAREKINDAEWETLVRNINGLKGIAQVTSRPHEPGFELVLLAKPSAEDSKRLAIATSFMIDDAIERTRAAK